MARTVRGLDRKPDGKGGTREGADRCPPHYERRLFGIKRERREGHMIERLLLDGEREDFPVSGQWPLPYYT